MTHFLAFMCGAFIGAAIGVLILSIVKLGKRADQQHEQHFENDRGQFDPLPHGSITNDRPRRQHSEGHRQ